MASTGEHVRRFCYSEGVIRKGKASTRTHWYSHPNVNNIEVTESLLPEFYGAVAADIAHKRPHRLGEWLDPRSFKFFVEVHSATLCAEPARLELGRLFARAVSHFNVQASSIMVLGWHGSAPRAHGLRLRYIFEDVIVDRRRASVMYNYILHDAYSTLTGATRRALVGDAADDPVQTSDWKASLPGDPYLDASNGERTLLMVGSYGMQKCPAVNVGPNHAQCAHCLGSKWVLSGASEPLALLHVLDGTGAVSEDPAKVTGVDLVARTALRAPRPLTAAWNEPPGTPATPCDASGAMVDVFKSEKNVQNSKTRIAVDDVEMLAVANTVMRRHDPRYDKLCVRRMFRCGAGADKYLLVHPHGPNDNWCPNICANHRSDTPGAGRIGFVVSSRGARVVCFCTDPIDPFSGKQACKDYKQREDLHPLQPEEKKILGLACKPCIGGSGPTSHQLQSTILPNLHAEVNGTAPAKGKKRQR